LSGAFAFGDSDDEVTERTAEVRLHLGYEANATYLTVYIPASPDATLVAYGMLESARELAVEFARGAVVNGGLPGDPNILVTDLVFAGRVFVYIESTLPETEKSELISRAEAEALKLIIRDLEYQRLRAATERPLAFISHDSRDKADVAQPLAVRLSVLGAPVWFDKFALRVGDNLRESIERGIRECDKCIVVVSPNFLTNGGWTKSEFEMIFSREIVEKKHVILPIWVGVTPEQVYEYSPTLAGRYAVNWAEGLDEVAQAIRRALA
jgi:hypothetical protein